MLPRTLEPEVMDTADEAADYDAMDHSQVNRVFVDDFLTEVRRQRPQASDKKSESGRPMSGQSSLDPGPSTLDLLPILDVGTGTALIPIELASRKLGFHITAVDLAAEMLAVGQRNVERAGHCDCITLERVDAKGLPYPDAAFHAVMSNSIIHHIPQPRGAVAEMLRVLKPGGLLFIRDLLRPETADEVEQLVRTYAGEESPRQQQLFRQSLHAALTVNEAAELMTSLNQPAHCVKQTTDRHWTITSRP